MIQIFILFAIGLTLAYALYYVAMIATDLAAQKKAAETEEETIDLGNNEDQEVDHFSPKHVVEDPASGGFNFYTPEPRVDEENEIAEAEETTMGNDTPPDEQNSNDDYDESQQTEKTSEADGELELKNEGTDGHSEASEDDEPAVESGDEEAEDDVLGGIPSYDFNDEEPNQEKKPLNPDEAFDRSQRQIRFDVTRFVEAEGSPEVKNHADTVNSSMEPTKTRSMGIISSELRAQARRGALDQNNIAHRDERTRM